MSVNNIEDYIVLASDVRSYGEMNTTSHFRTKLPRRKVFPSDEDWRVALTEITYKQSVYNVRQDIDIEFLTEFGDKMMMPGGLDSKLSAGYYKSIDDIIKSINDIIVKGQTHVSNVPKIYFNQYNQKVYINPGILGVDFDYDNVKTKAKRAEYRDPLRRNFIKFIPTFGGELEKMLGLVDQSNMTIPDQILIQEQAAINAEDTCKMMRIASQFDARKIVGDYPADINSGFSNMFIYSNIVQQTDVGDAFAPLLTTIPNLHSREGWGGSIHHEPKNLIYRPLQSRNFDTIEIDIKDDSVKRIPFKLGNVIIKLHFKKNG